MTQHTKIYNRFEYHTEDLDCSDCLYTKRKSKFHKRGFREESCRFEDIRQEAIKKGRAKRERGWNK
jgi:hypothetical protein